jgi:hypothetical protein
MVGRTAARYAGSPKTVTETGTDITHELLPMTFWYNNDRDFGSNGDIDEAPTASDYTSDQFLRSGGKPPSTVLRTRDLEDFARMRLVVRGIDDYLSRNHLTVGMRWVSTPTHALRVKAYRHADQALTMGYLHVAAVADRVVRDAPKVVELTDLTLKRLDKRFLVPGHGGYHTPLLWQTNGDVVRNGHPENDGGTAEAGEGRWAVVIGPPLRVALRAEAANPHVHLQAADFRRYYEHQTAGDRMSGPGQNPVWPTPTLTTTGDSGPAIGSPDSDKPNGIWDTRLNLPGKDQVILHVHGYRMQPWERRAFAETAAKRLYWEGYGGRMLLFSWPTEFVGDGALPQLFSPQNYDRSEFQARRSGTMVLPQVIDSLVGKFTPDRLVFMAHSMGNIVLAEALPMPLR